MSPKGRGEALGEEVRHKVLREGDRQEGQGSPNGGNRLQVSAIFYLCLKQQEEQTSVRFSPLSIQN